MKRLILLFLLTGITQVFAQMPSNFKKIGQVQPRHANEIVSSNWSIGTETMDRDYTIYKNWVEYLGPLGFKKARIQAGWQKTELKKGVYDFNWLDEIVFDMPNHGVEPWMVLCYGNTNYHVGGGYRLGADLPRSPEALEGWEQWVKANVVRYKDVIDEWEIWNESSAEPEIYADFIIRTSDAVRAIKPEATILAFSMSFIKVQRVKDVLTIIKNKGRLDAIDEITYHPYFLRPEDAYPLVEELRAAIDSFSTDISIRNGESGVPAQQHKGGALRQHRWSETSQSKWALRGLLGDLARNIESSHFALIDMKYPFKWVPADEIHTETNKKEVKDFGEGNFTMYTYGIVEANEDKTAKGPRQAYYSLQCLASIFDDNLKIIENYPYHINADASLSLFAFENKFTRKQVVTLWFDGEIPSDSNKKKNIKIQIYNGNFTNPLWVDLRTGKVFKIPIENWSESGTVFEFMQIPCYDSPVLIIDESLIKIQ